MAIRHIVLLHYRPGFLTEAYYNHVSKLFHRLQAQIPGMVSAAIYRNCVKRVGNYDLLAELTFHTEEDMRTYLEHPLHMEFAESCADVLLSRASFDCETR